MKAKIVNKTGFGVSDKVYFELESSSKIVPEDAEIAQANLGYHPGGYGFSNFCVEEDVVLMRFKATWSCQASCD